MKIGIGLPNPIPGTAGERLLEWARRSEEAGFSSLATIDRIAYPSYESLIVLAAAAGVTSRIGLLTNVLLGPTRNPVMLAKEAASVDQLSAGRLTLGLAVGGRKDDFDAVELSFSDRGKRWDRNLEIIHRVWKGELVNGALKPIGPTPIRSGGVPILIGGRPSSGSSSGAWVIRWGAPHPRSADHSPSACVQLGRRPVAWGRPGSWASPTSCLATRGWPKGRATSVTITASTGAASGSARRSRWRL